MISWWRIFRWLVVNFEIHLCSGLSSDLGEWFSDAAAGRMSRVCVGRLATCNELECAASSFFGSTSAPLNRFQCKKTCHYTSRGLPSLWSKNGKRGIPRLVISKRKPQHRGMWHIRPSIEDVLCQNASCPRESWQILKLASTWTRTSWLAGRGRISHIQKKIWCVSFEGEAAKDKKRTWCTICFSRQKSLRVDQVTWLATKKFSSQDHLHFAGFIYSSTFHALWPSLVIAIGDTTGIARSGAKRYWMWSRWKVSGRLSKTQSVTGLAEAQTYFSLAWRVYTFSSKI